MRKKHLARLSLCIAFLFLVAASALQAADAPPVNAVFKIHAKNYLDDLAAAAFAKTHDPEFQRPVGKNGETIIWEPRPSVLLKALGLEFGENNSISYVPSGSLLYASGDEAWLAKLQKIHRDSGIILLRVRH